MTDKEENKSKKNFRPNVAAIILSSKYPQKCEIFIASRIDISNAWQFPQGGIDDGESIKEALFRELEEEIGTRDVEIIAEYPTWVSYEFPPIIAQKMYPYDGQKQKYYLVKLKKGAKININTETPEFSEYKFVSSKEIYETCKELKIDYFQGYLFDEPKSAKSIKL